MKKIILLAVLVWLTGTVTSAVFAQGNTKIEDIDIGSKFTTYPNVVWLQGEPLAQFDQSKIYIVELWATWCVPCIAAMPHLKALNDAFKDKNVVFIAQDVMEGDQAKVLAFIQHNSNMQNFRVAFSGDKGSDFDRKWVQAAGVMSIPQTFVIQNNTLVWQTSPGKLNEIILQMLVDRKFTIDAANAAIKK